MTRRFLNFCLVSVVVLLVFAAVPGVMAQDAASLPELPPQVIDIFPLPGVELSPADALTITFDQPMNQRTVETAFTVNPLVTGAFSWADARTMRFLPDDGWPLNAAFAVTIAPTAATRGGVSLPEPVSFALRTVGDLEVSAVAPDVDATSVATDARVIVTFDRPVVPLGSTADMDTLPNPIQIEPAVSGTGEWVNTSIYAFTPDAPLAGSTTYSVSVAPGLTSVDGAPLSSGFSWQFTTLPPSILSVTPTANATTVPLDADVTVRFSQPMEPASVERAFTLFGPTNAPVSGSFAWGDANQQVTFTPAEPLTLEATYQLNINSTARSVSGEATLREGIAQTFTTVPFPRISETTPADGEIDVSYTRQIRINFNAPINPETLAGRVEITPEPGDWLPQVPDWEPQSLQIVEAELNADTTYTVTLRAGVEDVYGNAIAGDYTFTFTTGPIRAEAYPVINGDFMLTSAYRGDTRFSLMTTGAVNTVVNIFPLDITRMGDYAASNFEDYRAYGSGSFANSPDLAPWVATQPAIRSFNAQFDTGDATRVQQPLLLASDDGGQLTPGLYWIYMNTNSLQWTGPRYYQFALAVATANIMVKRTPDDALIWLTDLASAEPVADATVTVYHNGVVLASGTTDADGLYQVPVDLPQDSENIYITATGDDVYSAWFSNVAEELPTERGYLYTDRPIYRPGETVYFRGVLRDRRDMDFSVPDAATVNIRFQEHFGDTIFDERTLPLTEFGSFSGEFVIPNDAALGEIAIIAEFGDSEYYYDGYLSRNWQERRSSQVVFRVADFRVPEFEVTVTAQDEAIILGERADVLAEANFYAGGAVSNTRITVNQRVRQTGFRYAGPERGFVFTDRASYDGFYDDVLDSIDALTDANGRLLLTAGANINPAEPPRPLRLDVEAVVTDEANQPIAASASVLVHPADLYVGVRTDSYFGSVDQPTTVEFLTVTPDSVPVGATLVSIEIERREWVRQPIEGQFGRYNWVEEVTPVESASVTTDSDGFASYDFIAAESGTYHVKALVEDVDGRANQSGRRLYIVGDSRMIWRPPSQSIQMIPDQDSYVPGDTARIIIPLPFTERSTMLVTAERAGIMYRDVLSVEGSSVVYDLPITDAYAPTVHLNVTLLRGTDENNPVPDFAQGQLALDVEPVNQRLTVEVEPSSRRNEPRGTVSFDLRATDADGEPVMAEIGAALTDKAVLALDDPNSPPQEDIFYSSQPNYVISHVALIGLADRLEDAMFGGRGGGGGGGGGGSAPLIRTDFITTPLWQPHVVTDANGEATVSVTLPDNLTTWQFDARAVTLDTEVGEVTAEIVSTLPLIVRPVAPRFFVVGDRAELGAVINNNTDSEQRVEARLEATGVDLESDAAQTVTIPAGGRARVNWLVVVQDVSGVDLTFFAIGEDGLQDAAKPALRTGPNDDIPVYKFTAPDVVGTGGVLTASEAAVEGIALPTRYSAVDGELTVSLEPSLAVTTLDALDYLRNFEHQCTEQTVSRFLPNIITYRALRDLGQADPELEANLTLAVDEALARLADEQKEDGGWGWFPSMRESDPVVTAYAALALIEARESGFPVDAAMLNQALTYLNGQRVTPDVNTPAYLLNREAFFLYVLARGDAGVSRDRFTGLLDQRLRLSVAGRAYLLLAADVTFPQDAGLIDPLVSDLMSSVSVSANGAYWPEPVRDWRNWTSETRSTALALSALTRVQPDNPLLPNVVRWLMIARQGDHWQTTQETAWAVMALTDWMLATDELDAAYEYLAQINETLLAQAQVTPLTVRDGAQFTVGVDELLTDDVNRLTIQRGVGDGALYYTAYLDLDLPAAEVEALNRGINVTREYFLGRNPDQRITEARVGDVITVRLTLTLPDDVYYFVLEDPIPAGTENLDTNLATTSQFADQPQLDIVGDDPFWFWRYWLFDHTEQRDEQTNLYADFLPAGTYVYSYQVQATLAGEFAAMPAQAYAFYLPEVFGRSNGELFTILPAEE